MEKYAPNPQKGGVNRQFPAKSQKSSNFDIIKITQPIWTKFCTVIKTNNATSPMVPRMRTKNSRWRTSALLKIENLQNNSATVQPIATKFCTNTQIVATNHAEGDIIRIAYLSTILTWLKEFLLFYMRHIWALHSVVFLHL